MPLPLISLEKVTHHISRKRKAYIKSKKILNMPKLNTTLRARNFS